MIILVGNVGSTSLKSKLLRVIDQKNFEVLGEANLDNIKSKSVSNFTSAIAGNPKISEIVNVCGLKNAIQFILNWYVDNKVITDWNSISAMGFKCVMGVSNGANFLTPKILHEMKQFGFVAPAHNLPYLEAIDEFRKVIDISMVGVFEPSFHYTVSEYRKCLGLPFEWHEKGIKKLGFHGATHRFLSARAYQLLGKNDGRAISVHLGGSSSICAVKDGRSVDIDQHFTPNSGLLQGTRIGDTDVSAVLFAMKEYGLSIDEVQEQLSNNSGLKGVTGIGTEDFRLIEQAATEGNKRAQMAIQLYIDGIRKHIASMATVLGGIDCIVFGGGIGENNPAVREKCLKDMEFMGIHLDYAVNRNTCGTEAQIADTKNSKVKIYVIPTNEEIVVAYFTKMVLEKNRDLMPEEMEFFTRVN